MEDSLENSGQGNIRRKLIAGPIIIFMTSLLIISLLFIIPRLYNLPSPNEQESHSVTIWISPNEEEISLNVDFYRSEQNAIDRENNFAGLSRRVEPSTHEQIKSFALNLPMNYLNVWVKIYFDDLSELPCVIRLINIGQMATSTLLGIEISILIELYQ